ncbi:MAG: hypothetical protein FWG49_02300 [Leptospirales bacterium]|nr:hypothetical protein [Leptospirales bacterium]
MKFDKIKDFLLNIYTKYIKTFDPLRLSYFPFIGWFIPMIKKKDDDFYMYHAKQGFILALFFTCACTFLYLLPFFISTKAYALRFIIVLFIYILYAVYIALAIIGTRMIIKMEKKEFPFIGTHITKYASKLNI